MCFFYDEIGAACVFMCDTDASCVWSERKVFAFGIEAILVESLIASR